MENKGKFTWKSPEEQKRHEEHLKRKQILKDLEAEKIPEKLKELANERKFTWKSPEEQKRHEEHLKRSQILKKAQANRENQ